MNSFCNNTSNKTYKLIQWNALSRGEFFCNQKSFPCVDKLYLTWEYRKEQFKKITKKLNADIYCFEEIDDYPNFKLDAFENPTEYSSAYFSKDEGGQGIAIFYKQEYFELLESYKITLFSNKDNQLSNQFFSINFLREKMNPEKTLCVLVTHLKAKKENEEMRTHQVKHICETLNSNKEYLEKMQNYNCQSFVLCGDFNTEPVWDSVQYLKSFKFSDLTFNNFASAYNISDPLTDDFLECTTFKIRDSEYYRVIDYIFYAGKITIKTTEKTPNKSSADWQSILNSGLPCAFFPSDHHYIGINFQLL